MYNELDKIETVTLDVIKLCVAKSISNSTLFDLPITPFVYFDEICKTMVIKLSTYVYGEHVKKETITYPKSWWDGFKLRFFPKWLLKRFPPTIITHNLTLSVYYPNLTKKIKLPKEQHTVQLQNFTSSYIGTSLDDDDEI